MNALSHSARRRFLAIACAAAALVTLGGTVLAGQPVRAEAAAVAQPRLPADLSLRSVNYPDNYVRHRYGLGEISRVATDLDFQDATFRTRQGLADRRLVSFESVNYPGYYLRHQYGEIKLSRETADSLFRSDATFRVRPGLAGRSAASFESYNYPGQYIRHRFGRLYIDAFTDTDLYRRDASFYPVPGLWPR